LKTGKYEMKFKHATTIDARGLSCPMPQQLTLKAIRTSKPGETIVVLVDEAAAWESVIRTARALGLSYELEKCADECKINILRGEL